MSISTNIKGHEALICAYHGANRHFSLRDYKQRRSALASRRLRRRSRVAPRDWPERHRPSSLPPGFGKPDRGPYPGLARLRQSALGTLPTTSGSAGSRRRRLFSVLGAWDSLTSTLGGKRRWGPHTARACPYADLREFSPNQHEAVGHQTIRQVRNRNASEHQVSECAQRAFPTSHPG